VARVTSRCTFTTLSERRGFRVRCAARKRQGAGVVSLRTFSTHKEGRRKKRRKRKGRKPIMKKMENRTGTGTKPHSQIAMLVFDESQSQLDLLTGKKRGERGEEAAPPPWQVCRWSHSFATAVLRLRLTNTPPKERKSCRSGVQEISYRPSQPFLSPNAPFFFRLKPRGGERRGSGPGVGGHPRTPQFPANSGEGDAVYLYSSRPSLT